MVELAINLVVEDHLGMGMAVMVDLGEVEEVQMEAALLLSEEMAEHMAVLEEDHILLEQMAPILWDGLI